MDWGRRERNNKTHGVLNEGDLCRIGMHEEGTVKRMTEKTKPVTDQKPKRDSHYCDNALLLQICWEPAAQCITSHDIFRLSADEFAVCDSCRGGSCTNMKAATVEEYRRKSKQTECGPKKRGRAAQTHQGKRHTIEFSIQLGIFYCRRNHFHANHRFCNIGQDNPNGSWAGFSHREGEI